MSNLPVSLYWRWIERNNHYQLADFRPFSIEDQRVGAVHQQHLPLLSKEPDVFVIDDKEHVSLHPRLNTAEKRSVEVESILLKWHHELGMFDGWRNEPYKVAESYHAPVLMQLERATAAFFGIEKYGIHVNGITYRDGKPYMWIGQRAANSYSYPSKLDQVVAGGLGAAYSAKETMLKECGEEANIPFELASQAQAVGIISYCKASNQRLSRDVLFVYDLVLPEDFKPENTDGEVDAFHLWPLEQVYAQVRDTDDFKDNCNLVIIDFMLRHGAMWPEEPDYISLNLGLRQRLPAVFFED